jgi:hypothetical protein
MGQCYNETSATTMGNAGCTMVNTGRGKKAKDDVGEEKDGRL